MDPHSTKPNCIIKLGGSAITNKSKLETAKLDEINRAVQIIKECKQRGVVTIVVHGAGSFGHHQAKKYKVNGGYSIEKEKHEQDIVKQGFVQTRISVLKLNLLVTETLVKAGVPAVGISPCSDWTVDDGHVTSDGSRCIEHLLAAGFVPVLHGDCVLDTTRGCSILSGDTIIQVLCEMLSPQRVVFLSDVQGIYDKPPEEPGAKLLEHITVNSEGGIHLPIQMTTHTHDVTGGIQLKLKSASQIVRSSRGRTPVFICHVTSDAAFCACVSGQLEGNQATILSFAGS